jgi:hypothetical protein
MDVKIGEQPNIKFQLQPAAPITIRLETKYIQGGDSVTSDSVKKIVTLSDAEYNLLVDTNAVNNETLYLIYEE